MGENIANEAIELTIQGQTVSSNFGTVDAAQYNIEQLLHAGIYNHLFAPKAKTFTDEEENLMQNLADESFRAYEDLKNHPLFLDYLSDVSAPADFMRKPISAAARQNAAAGKLTLERFAGDSVCRRVEPAQTKCSGLLRRRRGFAKL